MNNIQERLKQWNVEPKDVPGHIYQVWEDGEVTMQKCHNGELLWQRNLHMMEPAFQGVLPLGLFPNTHGNHAYVNCADRETAALARELIRNNLAVVEV